MLRWILLTGVLFATGCASTGTREILVRDLSPKDPLTTYSRAIHRKMHPIWVSKLAALGPKPPGADARPLSALVLIGINPDGTLHGVKLERSSGAASFDHEAVDTVQHAAPFRGAPMGNRSCDGVLYLRWSFRNDSAEDGLYLVSSIVFGEVADSEGMYGCPL
jgi:TonB family protein